MTLTKITCCCCGSSDNKLAEGRFHSCAYCGHIWLTKERQQESEHYTTLSGRNAMPQEYIYRKLHERVEFLTPMIEHKMHVLEVGCAEGDLGQLLKSRFALDYIGVELSKDALVAANKLDKVVRKPKFFFGDEQFDLILSFHVLEHIPNPLEELKNWKKMLKPDGRVVVEVPNQSGHPWLSFDQNPEHIHQFNITSITALMRQAGFNVSNVSTQCFESPSYIDSIRLIASHELSKTQKMNAMINRVNSMTNGSFDVYGIGGDFYNYFEPFLQRLPVVKLFDSNPEQERDGLGEYRVETFNGQANENRPIVITSIRFQEDIKQMLLAAGVPENKILYLSDILM